MKLNGCCKFCGSDKIKQSYTYPSDYFCQSCGNGALISSLNGLTNSVWDKINNYFIQPDTSRDFMYLKPSTIQFAKYFKITKVNSHKDLALCFALARPATVHLFSGYPQAASDCPLRFMKHVNDTNGWLLWRNDLEAIINFHFGISNSLSIIKKLIKREHVDLTKKLSPDEIDWLQIYAPYTISKSMAQISAEMTVREFEKLT